MSDRFQTDAYDDRPLDAVRSHPPLPPWIARRLLRPDERVAWVYAPRFNPSWERYVTHIGLFLVALAVGVVLVLMARLVAGSWAEMPVWPPLVAAGLFFGSIAVLGVANGYFTRLVVTNRRLVILQGHEVCRAWDMNDLPRSLLRYRMADGPESGPSIDLDAMKSMLGTASDRFANAKTILAFGKTLGHIKGRHNDRTDRI